MNTLPTKALALLIFAGTAVSTAAGQAISWNNPAGGLWDNPANWDLGTFPTGPTESAVFNIGGAYTSTIDFSISDLDTISILDPMCTVSTNTGITLAVNNGIVNNGLILINNSNGGFSSTLRFNLSNSFTGTGTVRLNGSSGRSVLTSNGLNVITNGTGHTITGIGRLNGNFVNDGTVLSNDTSQTLALENAGWTNNSLIEVTNDAIMSITNIGMTQSPTGEILIDNGTLNLLSSSFTGGTIRSMPGESWTTTSGATEFFSVNTIGNGSMNTGTFLRVFDTLENDGQITVNSNNGGFQTTIEFRNPFTLTGNGSILLNGSSTRSLLDVNDASQLVTQTANHTINGFGTIRAPIINDGSIIANVAGTQLLLNTNNQINNNLYQVANGATLSVNNISIDQTGGGMIDLDDGTLLLATTTLFGGTIASGSGSTLISSGSNSFDNVINNAPMSMNTGSSLVITNGLENNSTLTINNTNGGFATTLLFADSSTLSGSGNTVLNGSSTRSQLSTDPGQTMTIASGHMVNGFGRINASLINNGTMESGTAGQTLDFLFEDKINNSVISAQPGATVAVNSIIITQDPSAMFDLGDGAMTLNSATIIDGSINADSAVVLHNSGTNTYNNITNNATTSMNSGAILLIPNGLENNDTITVNNSNGGFATFLNFTDSSAISGSGTILLNGSSTRAQITSDPGVTGTIGSTQTVRGMGQINASLINNGLISSDAVGQDLFFQGENKTNNSLIQIAPGARINISGIEIDQSAGGQILNNDGLLTMSNATIKGGTLDALAAGSALINTTVTYENLDHLTPTNTSSGSTLQIAGTVTNHNILNINHTNGGFASFLSTTAPAIIDGSGEILLSGTTTRSQISGAGLTLGAGQTLRGIGQINAPLTLNGTIAPGFSVGEMDASAPITLSDSSTYEVEISSATTNDTIDSSSTFHADGVLDVSLIDGFVPLGSFVVTIVSADEGVTGTFDTFLSPATPADPRLSYKIGYFDTEIRVGAVCDSDINFDGENDFFDISSFLALYTMQDPAADFNQDGSWDFFDISGFLTAFSAGCP